MSGIKGSLATLSVDVAKYTAYLDKEMTAILKAGVKIWLTTAVAIIPVWSGASRATLRKLGDKVGYNIPIFPVTRVYNGRTRVIPDRTHLGESASKGELLIQSPKYGFYYAIDDNFYLSNNETKPMNAAMGYRLIQDTPYKFREQADAAFTAVVRSLMKNFKSRIRNALRISTIRIG